MYDERLSPEAFFICLYIVGITNCLFLLFKTSDNSESTKEPSSNLVLFSDDFYGRICFSTC